MMWRVAYQIVLGGKVAVGFLMRVGDFIASTDLNVEVEGVPGAKPGILVIFIFE